MSLRPLLSRLALVLAASGLILVAAEMISRAAELAEARGSKKLTPVLPLRS